jgi:hypothetical protein
VDTHKNAPLTPKGREMMIRADWGLSKTATAEADKASVMDGPIEDPCSASSRAVALELPLAGAAENSSAHRPEMAKIGVGRAQAPQSGS